MDEDNMITERKLLNKCNKFMLTYYRNKNQEFYIIDLTLSHRYWTEQSLLDEYNEFFGKDKQRHSKSGWSFKDKEEARSLYNWAVLKWN